MRSYNIHVIGGDNFDAARQKGHLALTRRAGSRHAWRRGARRLPHPRRHGFLPRSEQTRLCAAGLALPHRLEHPLCVDGVLHVARPARAGA